MEHPVINNSHAEFYEAQNKKDYRNLILRVEAYSLSERHTTSGMRLFMLNLMPQGKFRYLASVAYGQAVAKLDVTRIFVGRELLAAPIDKCSVGELRPFF